MGQTTGIAWTDHTFNPWRGCTKVAPECAKCYAEKLSGRNPKTLGTWGPNGTRVVAAESYWKEPLKWNASQCCCRKTIFDERHEVGCPEREFRRVFCASLADVFEDWQGPMVDTQGRQLFVHDCEPYPEPFRWVPIRDDLLLHERVNLLNGMYRPLTMGDVRRRLFALIDATQNLNWLILTKRPENIRRLWPDPPRINRRVEPLDLHRSNVWLGTSAGTQESAEKFIPHLQQCRDLASVLFVSCEPMLEAVDMASWMFSTDGFVYMGEDHGPVHRNDGGVSIDWLIVGCESNGAKVGRLGEFPNESAWRAHAIKLMGECRDAGVPFFLKQWPDEGRVNHDPRSYPQEFPLTEGATHDPTQ